jgi:hypothetical protein
MSTSIGYKQYQEHFNTHPEIKNNILELSTIGKSHYNPELPKTSNVNTVLARPVRYYFNVTIRKNEESSCFKHSYYFDDIIEAKKAHLSMRKKFYDQKMEPYLKKIKAKNQSLSLEDKDNIFNLIDYMNKLKVIDR